MARPVTLALGGRQFTFSSKRVRAWLELVAGPHGSVPVIDPAAVKADVATLAKKVKRKPLETRFLITKAGKKFGFVAGRPGRQLDTATTSQRVVARVIGRRVGLPESGAIALATRGVEIKLSAAEASQIVPQVVLLSSWTTYFPQGSHNGNGVNIHLPAQIINGMVIKPGAIFDFVRTVGPLSWARGYRMGGVIRGDHTDPTGAVAGGICSASTTVFNAAARAGLDILTRDNHSYYISRYPLGLDATVSTQAGRIVQDMRFRNDTPNPIFISTQGGFGWVRVQFYRPRADAPGQLQPAAGLEPHPRHGPRRAHQPPSRGPERAHANTPPTGWMSRSRERCATCMVGSSIARPSDPTTSSGTASSWSARAGRTAALSAMVSPTRAASGAARTRRWPAAPPAGACTRDTRRRRRR